MKIEKKTISLAIVLCLLSSVFGLIQAANGKMGEGDEKPFMYNHTDSVSVDNKTDFDIGLQFLGKPSAKSIPFEGQPITAKANSVTTQHKAYLDLTTLSGVAIDRLTNRVIEINNSELNKGAESTTSTDLYDEFRGMQLIVKFKKNFENPKNKVLNVEISIKKESQNDL